VHRWIVNFISETLKRQALSLTPHGCSVLSRRKQLETRAFPDIYLQLKRRDRFFSLFRDTRKSDLRSFKLRSSECATWGRHVVNRLIISVLSNPELMRTPDSKMPRLLIGIGCPASYCTFAIGLEDCHVPFRSKGCGLRILEVAASPTAEEPTGGPCFPRHCVFLQVNRTADTGCAANARQQKIHSLC